MILVAGTAVSNAASTAEETWQCLVLVFHSRRYSSRVLSRSSSMSLMSLGKAAPPARPCARERPIHPKSEQRRK